MMEETKKFFYAYGPDDEDECGCGEEGCPSCGK